MRIQTKDEVIRKGLWLCRLAMIVSFVAIVLSASLIFVGCTELKTQKPAEFYSRNEAPKTREFRWTNGPKPKSFDPTLASAPPETDFARALFEGLTDIETKTLKAIPAIATEWVSSEDHRKWTFKLRKNAQWSTGEIITAKDFVRSWKRAAAIETEAPYRDLLRNFSGFPEIKVKPKAKSPTEPAASSEIQTGEKEAKAVPAPIDNSPNKKPEADIKPPQRENLGVEALDDFELAVTLIHPDKDFPKLVAHPIFRPVHESIKESLGENLDAKIVTNGAFKLESISSEKGITLRKSGNYWNRKSVKLERVRIVATSDAEAALNAYRAGEVDAVTNARIEPLALKILEPFEDFRQVTHSALNFYDFNREKEPFNDRRVRKALATAIDRVRLTEDELDGAAIPAEGYLPDSDAKSGTHLKFDIEKSKALFAEAGFENSEGFPKIRLLVNRNDTQESVAKSVAKMWKAALDVDTEIVIRESGEMEAIRASGDFDIIRRGVVLPTSDETANIIAIFKPIRFPVQTEEDTKRDAEAPDNKPSVEGGELDNGESDEAKETTSNPNGTAQEIETADDLLIDVGAGMGVLSEEDALVEVPAIPLYFPIAYSLVQPYILGFEINILDAPSLDFVEFDEAWNQEKGRGAGL